MHASEVIAHSLDQVSTEAVSIIVVDDDEDIRWLFNHILSTAGYDVEAIDDSYKALERIREKEFDIAILDYILPEMRGSQLAVEIRKIRPHMKVVFITGFAEFADEINNESDKQTQYALIKPVTQETLLHTIKMIQ
jgi:two-component system cell cycle sensor histidine kinase/response regulator CckA